MAHMKRKRGRKPLHFDAVSRGAVSRARTQAERVVAAFGGVRKLVRALRGLGHPVSESSVYRWLYPDRSGLVPAMQVSRVVEAAIHVGVVLTDSDWSPIRAPKESV